MTDEQGRKLGLPAKDVWRHMRIAGSKENYAPPPDKCTWFRLESVPLHNPTEEYPDGDSIGVATTWTPPSMFDGIENDRLPDIFQKYRDIRHSPAKISNLDWAGKPLMDAGLSEKQATDIVKAWIDVGVLEVSETLSEKRNKIRMVSVNEKRVSEILAEFAEAAEAASE
jgi:hypothetical protein